MKSLVAYRARKIIARIKGLPDQPVDWQPLTPEDVETFRRLFPRPKFFIFGHARPFGVSSRALSSSSSAMPVQAQPCWPGWCASTLKSTATGREGL